MILDDKPVITCIWIIKIVLKLSEWISCLPLAGHRSICSCHHGKRGMISGPLRMSFTSANCPLRWSRGTHEKWGPAMGRTPSISSETCWIFPESRLAQCLGMEKDLCSLAWIPGACSSCSFWFLQTHQGSFFSLSFSTAYSWWKTCTPPSETLDRGWHSWHIRKEVWELP